MFKFDVEKADKPEIKLPTSFDHRKSKRIEKKKKTFCFIDYVNAFDCVNHRDYQKFFKRWKCQMTLPAS